MDFDEGIAASCMVALVSRHWPCLGSCGVLDIFNGVLVAVQGVSRVYIKQRWWTKCNFAGVSWLGYAGRLLQRQPVEMYVYMVIRMLTCKIICLQYERKEYRVPLDLRSSTQPLSV